MERLSREALKEEIRQACVWEGAEFWVGYVKEEGYVQALKRLLDRVSEWRVVNAYEENITQEAKEIARMEWDEVRRLVEEVLDEMLSKEVEL